VNQIAHNVLEAIGSSSKHVNVTKTTSDILEIL